MREGVVLLLGRVREATRLIARSLPDWKHAVDLSCDTAEGIQRMQLWVLALCREIGKGLEQSSLDLSPVERAALVKLRDAAIAEQRFVANGDVDSEINLMEEIDRIDRVFWNEMPEASRRLAKSVGLPLSLDAWAIDQIGKSEKDACVEVPKGVSLLDAAIILNDGVNDGEAKNTVKRWRNSRSPSLPACIGKDPKHSQRQLYDLSTLSDFIEKVEGIEQANACRNSLSHRIRDVKIDTSKNANKPSAPSAKPNRRNSHKTRKS